MPEVNDAERQPSVPLVESSIKTAKTKIFEAKHSLIRQNRMDNNEENKNIVKRFHDVIAPVGSPRRIKDSSMMQILRIVSEDIYRRPMVVAQPQDGEPEIVAKTVDSIINRIKKLGDYDLAMRNLLKDATNREGSSFLMVVPTTLKDRSGMGKNEYMDKMEFRNIDSAAFFLDPYARGIEDSDWIAVRYEYTPEEADLQLEELYGYEGGVEPGDPLNVYEEEESGDNDEDLPQETTAIYEFWDRIKGIRVVFAGKGCTEIQRLEGEDYPYFNEDGQPDFPVGQLDATTFKYGAYAASYIDAAKDITEQKKRQFNQILPYFDRVSNQLLAITGVTPLDDIAGQIQEAEEFQEQGLVPFLSLSDPQSRISPVFPQDITAPLERIRNIFADELSDRLGLDLRVQQQSEQGGTPTATQVLERAKTHSKAIANINNLNVPFYKRISRIVFNYAQKLWDEDDKRKVSVNEGTNDEYILPLGDALKATKGWMGDFEVDTTVELELTRNEQVIVIQEIKRNFVADLQIPAMSEAEIKPLADTMKAHIRLVGAQKYFQDSEVDAFYQAIIARVQQQQEMQQQQQEAQMSGRSMNERKGATRGTPENQQPSANQGANAPQPQQL